MKRNWMKKTELKEIKINAGRVTAPKLLKLKNACITLNLSLDVVMLILFCSELSLKDRKDKATALVNINVA